MRNIKLPGCVDDVGKKQGYSGLSVRYTTQDVLVGDEVRPRSVCKVAYELTPDEVRSMVEGGKLVITFLGNQVSPHQVEVMTS